MRLTFLRPEKSVEIYLESRVLNKIPTKVPKEVEKIEIYGQEYTEIFYSDGSVENLIEPPLYVHDLIESWENIN